MKVFLDYFGAVVALVEFRAAGAVFVALLRIGEVSPALGSERVERAVAEQAVELVGIDALMAREVRALPVREKGVLVCFARIHAASIADFREAEGAPVRTRGRSAVGFMAYTAKPT